MTAHNDGVRVLVVEDEPMVRALAVRTLTEQGYQVTAAADGGEALAAVDQGSLAPDIMVTDIIMPGQNGRQLSDAVRARQPDVQVLYMSGHTGESQVLERLLPADAPFLQKPFTPGQLVRAVGALRVRRRDC